MGINELGGKSLFLDQSSTQIGRGESIADTAQVLSRYLDGLIIRAHGHEIIEEYARFSGVPVINALTDFLHPCQIYADCMTILEKLGDDENPFSGLRGKKLSFFGDTACNMANSWILIGALLEMEITLCGPSEFQPHQEISNLLSEYNLTPTWSFCDDPAQGAKDADVVYTDVWVSMGCEDEQKQRKNLMSPFQVTESTFATLSLTAYLCTVCLLTLKRRYPNRFSTLPGPFFLTKQKIACICKRVFFQNYHLIH